jgi:hypothetical protein
MFAKEVILCFVCVKDNPTEIRKTGPLLGQLKKASNMLKHGNVIVKV